MLPSSLTAGQSVVQVETLGEFGVFLIMFVVGLEFSPDKLQRVGHSRTVPLGWLTDPYSSPPLVRCGVCLCTEGTPFC